MNDMSKYIPEPVYYLIVGLFIAIPLFLLLREFWCWYWKINKRIDLLEQIRDSIRYNQSINRTTKRTDIPGITTEEQITCPHCFITQNITGNVCTGCGQSLSEK